MVGAGGPGLGDDLDGVSEGGTVGKVVGADGAEIETNYGVEGYCSNHNYLGNDTNYLLACALG